MPDAATINAGRLPIGEIVDQGRIMPWDQFLWKAGLSVRANALDYLASEFAQAVTCRHYRVRMNAGFRRGEGQTTMLTAAAAFIAQAMPCEVLLVSDHPNSLQGLFRQLFRGRFRFENYRSGIAHVTVLPGHHHYSRIVVADPDNADAFAYTAFNAIIGDLSATVGAGTPRAADRFSRDVVDRMPRSVPTLVCASFDDSDVRRYVNDAGYNYADPVARMETIRANSASSAGVTFRDAVVSPAMVEIMKAHHRTMFESLGMPASLVHCDPIKRQTDQPAASPKAAAADPMAVFESLGAAPPWGAPPPSGYGDRANDVMEKMAKQAVEAELDRIAAEFGTITVVDNPTAADRFADVVRAGSNAFGKFAEALFDAADAAFGFLICFVFDAIDAGCQASRLPGRFVRFVASRLSSVRGFVSRSEGSLTMFSKASLGFVAGMIACAFGPGLLRNALPPAMPLNPAAAAASYYTVSTEPAPAAVPAWTEVTIIGTEFSRDKGDSQVVESSDGRRFVITGQWGKNGDTFKAPTSELRATQAEGIAGWFASSTR